MSEPKLRLALALAHTHPKRKESSKYKSNGAVSNLPSLKNKRNTAFSRVISVPWCEYICVCVQIVFHGSWILYLSGAILVLWLCHQSDKERMSSKSGFQIWFWSKSSAHQMLKFEIDSTRKQQQNHYRWLLPTWSLLTNYMNEKRIVLLLLLSLVGLSLESFPLCIWVWLVGLKFLASVLLSVWK